MKPSLLVLALPSLALSLAFGCRNAAPGYKPVPQAKVEPLKGKVKSLDEIMPLDVGNQWTYALTVQSTRGKTELGSNDGTVSYRVSSREGTNALLLLEQDGKILEQQDWESSPEGLFLRTGTRNRVAYSPPQPMAQLPLDAGRTFRWKGSGPLPNGKVGEAVLAGSVRPPERVDTTMGPLEAIPVTTHTTFTDGVCDNVSWYHPGIGLVRVRQSTKDTATGRVELLLLTLTNYAVKGAQPPR